MKHNLDRLASISQAFENIIQWLRKGCRDQDVFEMVDRQWDQLKLSMLCLTTTDYQIQSDRFVDFIKMRFAQCRFDNFQLLKYLVEHIQGLLDRTNLKAENKQEMLQWFVQNYINTFGLRTSIVASDTRHVIDDEFIKQIVEWLLGKDTEFALKPTVFTKMEIAIQLVALIRRVASNLFVVLCYNEHQNVRKILVNYAEKSDLNGEFAVLLIRAQEQYLHFQETTLRKCLEIQDKPDVNKFVKLSQSLSEKIQSGVLLEVLLLIAECKVWTYYLSHYLGWTMKLPYVYQDDGIKEMWMQGTEKHLKMYLSLQDCASIGQLYDHCQNAQITDKERKLRQGLGYYLLTELWKHKGSRAVWYLSSIRFKKLFGFAIQMELGIVEAHRVTNTPCDNIFRLLEYCQDQTLDEKYIEMQQVFTAALQLNQINWPWFERRYIIHFIAGFFFCAHVCIRVCVRIYGLINTTLGVFNELYINKSSGKYLEMIKNFFGSIIKYLPDTLENPERCHDRVKYLLSQLIALSFFQLIKTFLFLLATGDCDCTVFKNTTASLENVQLYRLAWHFLGTVLSLPQSPFSILFHNPKTFTNQYLVAMPEDQSASLLQAMAGLGAWLCPNNHLYFVANCTATNESAKCPTCGHDIGNKKGAGGHVAATGNRRLGKVQADGRIVADDYGATEGKTEYRPDLLAPQGYVIMEGAVENKCRDFNEISIRVAGLFVNLILLTHHMATDKSDCIEFTKWGKTNADVMSRLLKLVQQYVEKIGACIGALSIESTLLLMHGIIHRFYLSFEARYENGFVDLSMAGRRIFETYLIDECIDPVIKNHEQCIREIRAQTTIDSKIKFWGRRVEEDIKPESNEFKQFQEVYLPNVYLPFRSITLSEFGQFLRQDPLNEHRYPVLWGIFKTIDTLNGFSIFAVQYLPAMIQWVKLIHSRFNRRLTQEEVEERPSEFSVEYALRRREENGWGDLIKWNEAWQGFVQGWNHVTNRVTTERPEQESALLKVLMQDNAMEGGQEEEKKDANQLPKLKIEDRDENGARTVPNTGINEFKRYLVIADAFNQCENIPFQCITGSGEHGDVLPKDVPLWLAIECGSNGPLATSKMIRLLFNHLVT
ncbi:hypothetical protein RFI_09668, partial [Reticulomyxa filosa]